jgi:Fur family peroxide stress response transcriptional regulator
MKTTRDLQPASLQQRLQEKGMKLTPQRFAIYQMLASTEAHPTADDIYQAVKHTFPMISQNTVYYTLSSLKEAGLVWEVPVEHAPSRYDANMDEHHHLICLTCGKITDLYDEALDRLTPSNGNMHGYEIRSYRVEFYGYCERCQTKRRMGAAQQSRQENV